MGKEKTLKIYKENNEFVIERDHATKLSFISDKEFKEGLDAHRPVMDEYEIVEVSEELWALVVNHLNK